MILYVGSVCRIFLGSYMCISCLTAYVIHKRLVFSTYVGYVLQQMYCIISMLSNSCKICLAAYIHTVLYLVLGMIMVKGHMFSAKNSD
jgi:hypothetical protein